MSILANSNAIESGGYNLQRSLRFRSSASAYLNRTFSTPTSSTTWTWSGWVKRGIVDTSADRFLFAKYQDASNISYIRFSDTSIIRFYDYSGGVLRSNRESTAVYRDPSAWYHVVVAYDSGNATAANRVKIYINGSEVTSFSASTNPNLNQSSILNSSGSHTLGNFNSTGYFDGYMTEVNFIDGQALTPSSFGATDATTGVWQPKKYTGTYGTNGFYLPFTDTSSTTNLVKDSSGNANNWTPNNISLTSGTTYDSMTDVPTLTSATAANYAVLNTLDKTGGTVSNGNLTIVKGSTGAFVNIRGTMSVSSGKWYYETTLTSGINYSTLGILSPDVTIPSQIGDSAYGWDWYPAFAEKKNNGTSVSYGTTASAGDVIMCAFDVTNGKIWWGKNGTWFASGDPAAGTNAAFTNVTGTIAPAIGVSGTTTQLDANFGQRPFTYTPPTGFVALNTYNLPTPTIIQGNTNFNILTWTGTGTSSGRSFTGVGFAPDLVWAKPRSVAYDHNLNDKVRGANKRLRSNTTDAENTNDTYGYLSAFDSDGWTTVSGATENSNWNQTSATYVAWCWKANGAGSSNTDGSITSTVSVNSTAGFSIVTYTGTGANATVGHGLGVAPKMVIAKSRSQGTGYNWVVYHTSIPATQFLRLNTTDAVITASTVWNNTAPTSTVFSVGTDPVVTGNGQNFVAYCWAAISGYSAFGSYTGNGSADGVFVATNFTPKFIMIKRTDTANDWNILNSSQQTYNQVETYLLANSSNAEGSSGNSTDFLSNGFKLRTSNAWGNANGGTYIYMAFASNPFKNSLAR
jgi:hypothetical protein